MSYKRGNDNFADQKTVAIAHYRVKLSTEIRQISTRQFWLHFDVVEPPIGCLLIHFSKSTSNKLPNHLFCFYIWPCFCKKYCQVTFSARFDRLSFKFKIGECLDDICRRMANVLMTSVAEWENTSTKETSVFFVDKRSIDLILTPTKKPNAF
jgi:hypothetical protein